MIDPAAFERQLNGKDVRLFYLSNGGNLQATITNFGARVLELVYNGVNVTPSYSSLEDYMSPTVAPYHGATVGRYANRIAKGRFALNGKEYQLPVNNGANHLHGGPAGFHHQVWNVFRSKKNEIVFTYFSKSGEEGYPGNVNVTVTYAVTEDNELAIAYSAKTTEDTPFNITNHAFFNLNGDGSILKHQLQINAARFTPVDETLIPMPQQMPVEGTAFDFRQLKLIGDHIDIVDEEQIKIGGGYDHNFVLNKSGNELSFAAKAIGDVSGIVMEVFTEEPGLQLFSGNFEAVKGDPSTFRNTFCLETQHFPDSPNRRDFPSTILKVGDTFTSKTVYRFSNG